MVPKGFPRSPVEVILGTFGVPMPAFERPWDHLWPTSGPTADLVGFRGPGRPPGSAAAAGAETPAETWENTTWASREWVIPREYAHPAKRRYAPQPK